MTVMARQRFIGHTTRFVNTNINVAFVWRESQRDNGFHGDSTVGCDFGSAQAKKWAMATKSKKPRARWGAEAERKLIDIWADILGEFDGVMMTRKKKEAIATTRLNVYVTEELNRTEKYIKKEVCNKLDTIMKKGKLMYVNYQWKGETGKECTQDVVDIDIEAAEKAL